MGTFRALAVFCLGFGSLAAQAAADEPHAPAGARDSKPRICLVLSGGGARGMAHIGVLKVLEELHVPIDCIAGTSMGAVVGGLYASGMNAHDIEAAVRSVDWQDAFRDAPSRRDLAFRRKQDDRNYLVQIPLGLKHGRFQLPKGLVQGEKLQATLRSLTLPVSDTTNFDALPTPFRAVATDLESGAPVVLDKGDLPLAMRASMSAPVVFAPVEINGRLLADGGLAENLPIDVARGMGADILIVVDVTFPLQGRAQLTSPLAMNNQMLAILMRRDGDRQTATLKPPDVLVAPDLEQIASTDFGSVAKAIAHGEDAARDMSAQLAALGIGESAYRQYAERRAVHTLGAPLIRFVRVDPDSEAYEKTIMAAFSPLIGKPLDTEQLAARVTQVYGLGEFEMVDYSVVTEGEGPQQQTGIEVRARRKSWGPNYIRFGLNLQDNFQGNDYYNAAVRFLVTDINSLGAEWRTDLQIGNYPLAATEFYQPLTAARTWFVAPAAHVGANDLPVYSNNTEIADFRERTAEADFDLGRELGSWGEVRVGYHRINGQNQERYGDPNLVTPTFNNGEFFFKFSYDKLDNVDFPRDGQTFTLRWDANRTNLGADIDFDQVTADWLSARSRGRNTLLLWASAGSTVSGNLQPTDLQDFYTLGGFLNLSGRAPLSLTGPNFAIARAVYLRKIGRGGEGFFEFPAYLGASIEVGNTWQEFSDINWNSAHKDASIFVGFDTLLGPLYIGSGYDSAGYAAYFLYLGRTF